MYDSDSDGCDLSNMLDDDIETDEDDDDYVPGKQDSDEEYGKKKRKGSKTKFVPGRRSNRAPARGRKRKNTDKSDEEEDDDIDEEDEDSLVREKKTNKKKVAKKSPAKKAPAKKYPVKKTPTKKAPAKKTTPKRKKQDSASDDLEDTPGSLRRSSRGSRSRAVSYADADCSEEEMFEDQTFDVFQDIKEEKASRAKKKRVDDLWSKFKDDVTEKDDKTKGKKEESDKKDEKSKDEKSNDEKAKEEKNVSENIEDKEEIEKSVKKEEKSEIKEESKDESKDEKKEETDTDVKKEDTSKAAEKSDKTASSKTEDTESKNANGEGKETPNKDSKSEEDKSNSENKAENGKPEKEDSEKKAETEKSETNGKVSEKKEEESDSKATETPSDKPSVKADEKKEDAVNKPIENKKDDAAVEEKESSSSSNDKTQEPSKEDTAQKKSNVSAGISNFLSSGVKKTGGLSSVMNAIEKKKKTTVLEKTKSDWDSYKSDADIEEELKGNRNAGYLDRQEFLQRVDYNQWENEREMRLYSNRSSVSFGMLKPCAEHVNILFSIPPTTVMQKTTCKSEPIKNRYTNCNLSSTQNIIKRIEEPFSIKSFQNAEKNIKNEDYLKKSRYANSFGTKNNLVLDLSARPASPCFSVDSAIDLSHDLLSNPGSSKSFDQDSITSENIDFVKTSVFFDQNTTDYKNIAKPVEVGIDLNMNSYSSSLLSFKKPDLNSGSEFSLKNNSNSKKGSMTSSNHINLADKLDLKKSVISSADVYPTKRLLIEEAKNAIVIVENIEVNDTKSKISLDNRKNNDFSDSNHSFNDYDEQNESGVNSSSFLFPRNKDRLSKIKQNETTPKKKKRFLKNIIDMKRKQLNPKENELSNVMEVRTNQDSHGGSSSEVSSPSNVTTAISSIVPITTDTIESTILHLNQKSNISFESDDIIEKDEKQGKTSYDVSSESEDNGPPQRRSVQKQKKNRDDFPDSNCSSVHDPPFSSSIPSDSDANFTRLISLTVKDAVQEGVELKRKHKRRTSQLRELTRLLSDDESNSSAGEHLPPQEFTQNLSTFTDLISKKLKQKKTKQEKREKGQVTRTNQDMQQQNSTAPLKHSHVNSTADVPKSVKKSSRGPNEKTVDRPASSNSPKLSDFYLSVNSPEKQRQAMNKKNVSRKEPDILHEYCKQINSKQNENERSNDYFTMAEKFLSQTDESSSELRESSDGSSNNMSMRKLRNSSKCSKCFCRATKRTIEDCIICPTDDCMSYDSLETNEHLTDPDYVPETLSSSTEKSSSFVSESSLSLQDNVHLTESSISTSYTQQDSGTAASDSSVYVPALAERNSRSRKNAEKSSSSVSESSLSLPDNALNKSNYLTKTFISASNTQQDSDNAVSDSQEDSPDNVPALVERNSNSYGSISTENVHLENNRPSESSKHTLETPEILSEGSTMCSNDGSQSKSLSSPETESDSCHTKISNLSKSCVSSVKVVINDVFKSAELVYLDPYVDCTLTQNQDVDITEKSAEKSTNHQHTTTSLLSQSAPLSNSNQLKNVKVDLDSDNSSIDDYKRRPEVLTGTIKHLSGLNVDENNDANSDETDEQLVSTVTHSNDVTNDDNVEFVLKKSDVSINNNDENDAELVLENLNVEYSNDEDENEIKSISSDVENKIDNDPKVISNHSNVVSSNAEIDNQHVSKGSDVDDSEPELISNHSDIESSSDNDDAKLVPNYSDHADADDSDIEDGIELISNHSDVESSNAKIEDKHVSECSDDENSEPELISNHSDVDSSNDDDDAKFISNYSDNDDSNNEDDTELISNHSDVEKGKGEAVYKSNILMESTKEIMRNESPNILFYSKVDSEIESKRCFVESNHEQQSDSQLDSNINSLQSNQDTSEKNTKLLDADQVGITKSDDEVLRKSSNPRRSRRVKSDVDVFMSNDESQRITKETELCFSPVKKKKSSQSEKSSIQSKENSSSVTAASTSCACSNNSATKKSRRQRNSTGGLSFTTTRLDFSPNKSGFQQPVRRAKMSIKKSFRVRTCTLRPDLTPRKFLVSANYNEDIELETILRPDLERISKTLANSSTVESNLSSELQDVSVEDIITTKCIPIIQIEDDIPNAGIEIEQEPEYLLEKEKQPVVSLSKPSIENNLSMQSFILSDYTSSEEIASKVAHAERKTIRKGGRASRRRSSDDRVIIPIVDCSGNIFKQPSSTRDLLDLTQPNPRESQEGTNNMSHKETMYQCDFTIDSPYLKDNFSASKKSFNSNEESSVKAGDNQTNRGTNSNQTNIFGSSPPAVMEQPKPFGKNMAFRTEHMIVRDDNEKIPFIFQKHHIASQQSSKDFMNSRAHLKSSNRGIQKEPLPGFDVECFSKYLSEPSINTSMMEELGCSPVVDLQKNQHSETKENRHKIFARKSIDILRASCLHVINDSEFISSEHKETSVSDLQNSEMYEDLKSIEDPQFSSPPHKILLTENAVSDFETTPSKSVTTVCDEVSDDSPKRKRFLKKIVKSMINDANVKDDGIKEQRILVERGKEHVPRKRFLYAKKL